MTMKKVVLSVDLHRNYQHDVDADVKRVIESALAEYKENHGARAMWPITHVVVFSGEKVATGQKFENDKTIREHALEVLQGGPLVTTEVADAVVENGYVTTSVGFRNTVRLNLEALEREGLVVSDKAGWRLFRRRRTAV